MTDDVELIRAHDSALGATLDVPLPSAEPVAHPACLVATEPAAKTRGLVYRGVRKIYRSLKRVDPLRPLLEKLRDGFRRVRS